GDMFGFEAAATMAAFRSTVFLLGVPRRRPPRLSPGFDPLGIALSLFSGADCVSNTTSHLSYEREERAD
ncbi:MAG: hypothetical protein ABWZ64_01235, partial [Xanthobacteraceae bacterium]